ncbi:DsbA family protein [Skermania piniformis]|uniref:Thioredoxin domain-containing protein n=1 Tax=Skermania pinensis TaxID=39122 RepID=A0ABX8S4Z2_9ACTN|nr:thioredoxin domain-containing protein [Skermania piniformis]QXQ12823.1 thioredoxin domain-containing protein [Skermania piniformis]
MNAKSSRSGDREYVPQPSSSRSTYLLGGLALLLIAGVVIGGVLWTNHRNETRNDGYGSVRDAAVTAQAAGSGVVTLGRPRAARTIDVFEEPMCPHCAQLEQTHGQEIAQAVDDGKLAVRYHMLDFLDGSSASGDYSTRVVAASACIAETGAGPAYAAFHSAIFAPETQPREGSGSDHSNAELADIARAGGANDAAVQCISSGTKVSDAGPAAQASAQALAELGGKGTPAVFSGTTAVDVSDPSWVAKLIG